MIVTSVTRYCCFASSRLIFWSFSSLRVFWNRFWLFFYFCLTCDMCGPIYHRFPWTKDRKRSTNRKEFIKHFPKSITVSVLVSKNLKNNDHNNLLLLSIETIGENDETTVCLLFIVLRKHQIFCVFLFFYNSNRHWLPEIICFNSF